VNRMVSFCLNPVVRPHPVGRVLLHCLLFLALFLHCGVSEMALANETLPQLSPNPVSSPSSNFNSSNFNNPAHHPTGDYRLTQQEGADLSRIELTLFKASYAQEPVFTRLNRIESTLYGETQGATSPSERLARLKSLFERRPDDLNQQAKAAMPSVSKSSASKNRTRAKRLTAQPMLDVPKEIASKTATPSKNPLQQPVNPELAGDHTVDYPHINAMEQQAFGQVYSQLPLSQRIDRLEIKVFGQPGQGELMHRVDLLSQRLLSQPTIASNQAYPTSNANPYNPYQSNPYQANQDPAAPPFQTYTPPPGVGTPLPNQSGNGVIDPDYEAYGQVPNGMQGAQNGGSNNPSTQPSSQTGNYDPSFLNALSQTEKKVLKTSYPNDPPQVRLGRMESKLFHTQAPPSVSEEDRLQRIIAVQAGGGGTSNPMTDRGSTFRTILPILLMIVPLLL
jgi:hypothetical protein